MMRRRRKENRHPPKEDAGSFTATQAKFSRVDCGGVYGCSQLPKSGCPNDEPERFTAV